LEKKRLPRCRVARTAQPLCQPQCSLTEVYDCSKDLRCLVLRTIVRGKHRARGERCCDRCTDSAQALLQTKAECTDWVIEQGQTKGMLQRSYAWFDQLAWVEDFWKAFNCACIRNTHIKYTKALNMQGSLRKCGSYLAVSAVQPATSCDKCLHLCWRRVRMSYRAYSARSAFYRTQPGEGKWQV